MRVKSSRKETKESAYWLRLIHETKNLKAAHDVQNFIQEANELKKIFSSTLEISRQFRSLELEIYLKFDAWNLGFERFRERLQILLSCTEDEINVIYQARNEKLMFGVLIQRHEKA